MSSLYTSRYEHETSYAYVSPCLRTSWKMSANESSIMPGSRSSPTIVCVLPDPVAPYAKTVPLRPFNTPSIKTLPVFSYTSLFVARLPKAQS